MENGIPKEFGFTEDKIFGWVMENEEFCLYVLRIILPFLEIKEIVEFNKQDALGNDQREAKDIRLDIKVVDKDGRIFDIEMQTSPSKYLGRRLRYYQSTIDGAKVLKPGHDYSELPDTFIIFLCSFDPSEAFSKVDNRAVHFFKTIDTKDHALELIDGATKVIINSKGDFTGEKRGKEIGEKVGEKRERLAGVKKLIATIMSFTVDEDVIFNKVKEQYDQYFSDVELKQFIAEAKNEFLQET